MAASTFPPLYHLSQNPEDQASLGRIKAAWDEYSSGWDQETKMTILSRLHEVRTTSSNRRKPSDHKIRREGGFNFGIWVMIRCIYPTHQLRSLKTRLVEKYPWIDPDSFAGPGRGRPIHDMGYAHGTATAGESARPDLSQPWQGLRVQNQDWAASYSHSNERTIKREGGLAPVFTQPHHTDGLSRQQDPSFNSLRPVQSLFAPRQNVAQPATAHPSRTIPFTDVNPRPTTECIPQSDSFANFLKRKAEDDDPISPSKKPRVLTTRAPSPMGFDSRSSFLDDESDCQAPNAQPEAAPKNHHRSYDPPKECCKLYHERCNAEFTEALEQMHQRMQADLKTLVQRYGEDVKRAVNPPGTRQQQQRSGDGDPNRDAFLEYIDTRVTRLEELFRLN